MATYSESVSISPNKVVTSGRNIHYIVIHTMEASEKPTTAENVAVGWFGKTVSQASAHWCHTLDTKVLRSDLRWVEVGTLEEGDTLWSTQEHSPGKGNSRTLEKCVVTKAQKREAECLRITLEDGRTVKCTLDHQFLTKPPVGGQPWKWTAAETLQEGNRLCVPLDVWEEDDTRDGGYIAGMFDGEGCATKNVSNRSLSFAQKNNVAYEESVRILKDAGIPTSVHIRDNGVHITRISGSRNVISFLGKYRPRRLLDAREDFISGRALRSRSFKNDYKIVNIEPIGVQEVMSLETSTHTYFAEGIVSHNCFDNNSRVRCVEDKDVAWAAPGANSTGLQYELAGYAAQDAAGWNDDYSKALLDNVAQQAAKDAKKFGIPIVHLTKADILAGKKGFIGHVDATNAFRNGVGHTDPGKSFPWDAFLELVRKYAGQATPKTTTIATARTALTLGSTGARVKTLQTTFNTKWLLPNKWSVLVVDGSYGPATSHVVKAFQKSTGLVVDGVAGPKTLEMIKSKWGVSV